MKNRIIDYIEKSIATLESRKNYTKKEAEDLKVRIVKLITVENDITEEEINNFITRLDNLISNAKKDDLQVISKVSTRSIKIPKRAAVAATSLVTAGAIIMAGINFTGCSRAEQTVTQQEIDVENLKADLKAEIEREITEEQATISENSVQVIENKVISENLSFDPNSNDELVNRMTDFIADSWSKGIDVPVDKMMDYYMVMNLEDIDPIDYARLGYSNKTAEDILNNYQYCANLYMDDILTIKEDTTVDYSLIVADKDSAKSVNDLQQKIAQMNSKTISSDDVHDYIYDTYIEGTGQRQFLYNVGPNFQAYNFMFSYDELTNGKGLSKSENDILNEDRVTLCSTQTVDGEKNKSDKAQEQSSIINQLEEKLEFARNFYTQDLTNVSDSEKRTGVELENEITSLLKERNAQLVENPEFRSSFSYTSSSTTKSSSGSVSGGSSSSGGNTTYSTLTPEQEQEVRNSYTGSVSYKDNDGNPVEDPEEAKKKAEEEAKKQAEEEAKKQAEEETKTEFEPVDPTVVDTEENTETDDYEPVPETPSNTDNNNSGNSTDDNTTTETIETEDYTGTVVETEETIETEDYTDTPVETEQTVETQDYSTSSNADLLNELYAYRNELLSMTSYYETEENNKIK